MLVFIHAYEGMYQGFHGIEDYDVFEVTNEKEANYIGEEMASNVIEEYSDCFDDDEEEYYEAELLWDIYSIKDGYSLDLLKNALNTLDAEQFIEEYCKEEVINGKY